MMKTMASRLLAVFALLIPVACSAQPEAFVEGQHYQEVRNVESRDGDQIRVSEVFWYGCPHCFRFAPHLREWKADLPGDVVFERLPTALGRAAGRPQVKAYFAAGELGVQEDVHMAIFDAIHNRGQRLGEAELAALFEGAGVAREDFEKAFNSFTVENRTRRAEKRVSDFGVTSTPTMIVDGRWQIGAGNVNSFGELLDVVDFLIDKARRER